MEAPGLVQMLSASALFATVDKALLRELFIEAPLLRLQPGQHLFHMGDSASAFFLVQSGSLILYRPTFSGEQKIFRSFSAGELLAETVMFNNPCRYPLSAQVQSESVVYRLPREGLYALCRTSSSFCLAMLEAMAVRIAQSLNRIDLLTIGNSSQRLVAYLLDLHAQQRSRWLQLPASHGVLARQLNVTAETFSRLLGSFKRAGLLDVRNNELLLLDIPGLCHEVGLPDDLLQQLSEEASSQLGCSLCNCCCYN